MAAPKTVTLTDTDGNDVLVSHPADINTLVYGHGYKVKGNQTPDQAIAALAEQADAVAPATATNVTETKTAK